MNKKTILLWILALFLIGCGNNTKNSSSKERSSRTSLEDNQRETIFRELTNYSDVAIIYRATEEFCKNNNILTYIKDSNEIINYQLAIGDTNPECADFAKTSEHCDTFIAQNEPGSLTCVIGYNVR